ncbi:hypothetical protein ACFLV6_02210 [Chloroflexota bacterium]
MTAKSPPHALVEEPTAIFCRQRWRQENVSFPGEDINRGESKEFSEIDGVGEGNIRDTAFPGSIPHQV